MSKKLPCGHPTDDLYRDPSNAAVYRCPSCMRFAEANPGLMPPMDMCRWVEGTFQLPAGDGSFEAWAGRVFLAVCEGGMQDPASCYCAEYVGTPRNTIRYLRDQLAAMQDTEAELDAVKRDLFVARRRIYQLKQRLMEPVP